MRSAAASAIAVNRGPKSAGLQRAALNPPFNCPDAKELLMNKSITILLATLGLILSQPALADIPRVQTLRGADDAAKKK